MRRLRTRMWFKGATSRQDPGGERVCVCVDLSCSLGNRQQQEKKSLGVIGQRFYPLWPIKLHLCAYKQPIRDLMPSWGDRRISSGNTHTHTYTHWEISYTFAHTNECLQWWESWSRMVQCSVYVCIPQTGLEPVLIQGTKKPFCEPANISTDLRAELL